MKVRVEHVTHPDAAFRFLRFESLAGGRALHRHRQLELTWIEQGAGVRLVGNSAEPFQDGDLVLLGPDVPHAWIPGNGRQPLTASVLQFPISAVHVPALPELAALQPVLNVAGHGIAVGGATAQEVRALLTDMESQPSVRRLATFFTILASLAQAARPDLRRLASSALSRPGAAGTERRIERVTRWVAEHFGETVRVADAARLAGVTPAAFSRFFRRELGKAFATYVNDVRCSAACAALRTTDRPVAGIATACGFASQSHFNRQFRKRYRLTPRQYRRQDSARG